MKYSKLALICLGALALRLALSPFIEHPGIGDPNHYYNLGRMLVEGNLPTFYIDYIWQYNNPPPGPDLTHPDDNWMPLTNVFVATSMQLFGFSVQASILPFILMGAIVPVVCFVASRQFGVSEGMSLFVAGVGALLPEFVLNSLRTDTTIPNLLLACGSILLLTHGLRHKNVKAFIGSGILAGLAYLVRSDSSLLLPMAVITVFVYALWDNQRPKRLRLAALWMVVTAILVAVPWSIRNLQVGGTISTPKLNNMFFLTDILDHYVYDTELNLQTLLASQTPAQLIGKRLFEMAASAKIMYTTLDMFLPVAVLGGLLLVVASRDRERLLTLAPVLILIAGTYLFYTVLVPYKNQGGSYKKAYLTLIPLLLPLAGYALERAIADWRMRNGAAILILLFLGANAVELVRADAQFAAKYLHEMRVVAETALSLPDTNDDGEIILMAQDPFMLRFLGIRSVMIPMEDRDTILEVAQIYNIDYLMMPPARPALDPIYLGKEEDSRFVHVADVPGLAIMLYGFAFD
jgi:hypothetical protein